MWLYVHSFLALACQVSGVAISLIDSDPGQKVTPVATTTGVTLSPKSAWTTLRTTVYRSRTIYPISTTSSFSSRETSSTGSSVSASVSASVSIAFSSSSSSSLSQFQSQVLHEHNAYRRLHNAPDLQWSSTLQNFAANYANRYNCNGTLIHSNSPYGENLALGFNTSSAVAAWYNEFKLYNYNKPGFSEKTGHFTQLVWKSTTQMGCAYVDCGDYYGQYTICNYDPPGNVAGQYQLNVLES
ncbi:CAP domain-containing protein LALA0_S10e04148g [Lachancea lanzarotensis]|uniref:LALA0S10e04148g1_1 n=1 Tax=Lachancea lanzarotensis TaxID=1245769 RepID=A0A0C7NEQ4_9SACH|nr:uncharacterized protein LALA0_S10e04148g [Lachancea lanzarotensis]CEP64176.1 LALA0S10e04148g1_1 [Lachancea lanzarotensis]